MANGITQIAQFSRKKDVFPSGGRIALGEPLGIAARCRVHLIAPDIT
jgi:acetyl-CoA acetyltransferase